MDNSLCAREKNPGEDRRQGFSPWELKPLLKEGKMTLKAQKVNQTIKQKHRKDATGLSWPGQ